MMTFLKKHQLLKKLQQAMLLVLVILLAAEPILVTASPQLHETQQEEIGTFAGRYTSQVSTGEFSTHIGSLGDLIALIPFMQVVSGASFLADAAVAVMKALFKNADPVFQAILNGLKLTDAFNVIIDFLKVTGNYIGSSIGHNLSEAIQFLSDLFTGGLKLWDNFVAFVKRVGVVRLLSWGFDEGSLLVGGIIRRGSSLSDEALRAVDNIGDELFEAGIKLSDEAANGLARATKLMNGDELKQFTNKLVNTCVVSKSAAKLARPALTCNPDLLENILKSIKQLDDDGLIVAVANVKNKIGLDNFGNLIAKYGSDPIQLTDATKIFSVLGDSAVSKETINAALNAGSALGKGPEAVRALAGWGDFVKKPAVASDLAKRAGKDALALEEIAKWTPGNVPSDNVLQQIGVLSRDGVGSSWGLGVLGNYDSGFVQAARANNAQFYFTHPEVGKTVTTMFSSADQTTIFWKINESALNFGSDAPIKQGIPFSYTMDDLVGDDYINEKNAIVALRDGMSLQAVADDYFGGVIRFRMRELDLLFKNGYTLPTTNGSVLLFTK